LFCLLASVPFIAQSLLHAKRSYSVTNHFSIQPQNVFTGSQFQKRWYLQIDETLADKTWQNILKIVMLPIANMATMAPKRGYSVATVAKGRSRLFSNISFPSIGVS